MACAMFGLELKVYMVRISYEQKPYRRMMIETWGGSVVPSPVVPSPRVAPAVKVPFS